VCSGASVKGKTYEEIYGVEKAQQLKEMRRISSTGKNNKGSNNPMWKRYHTLESRIKMGNSRIAKNSGVGWFWINDGNASRKIKGTIPSGWVKGRLTTWKPPSPKGKIWINNGEINHIHDPEISLPIGFKKGRLFRPRSIS